MQTCDLRRALREIEERFMTQVLCIGGEVNYVFYHPDAREWRARLMTEINEVMYEPYPPWSDEIAPDDYHPAGPHYDGTHLVRDWG